MMIKNTYTQSAYELHIAYILIHVSVSTCVCVCVFVLMFEQFFRMKVNASYYILYVTQPLNHVINCGPKHVHIL